MYSEKNVFAYENRRFVIQDCGGGGSCLFKSLMIAIGERDHLKVRRQIVDYVIDNWQEFEVWVLLILKKKTARGYRTLMSPESSFGSELECRAAAQLYNKKITVIRRYRESSWHMSYGDGDEIFLLFTGMGSENDRDGHYQLLHLQANNEEVEQIEQQLLPLPVNNEDVEATDEVPRFSNNSRTRIADSEENPLIKNATIVETSLPNNYQPKKLTVYTKRMKEVVAHARMYFEQQNFNDRHVESTAKCLGISESTVKRISKEFRENGGFCDEPKVHLRGRNRIELDSFERQMVREKVFEMYMRREYPTVKSVLTALIEENEDFPRISEHTLRETLKDLKFEYRKYNNKPVLMESWVISGKRHEYLSKIRHYRRDGWNVYYTDETWCGANHSRNHGWVQQVEIRDTIDSYDHLRSGVQQVDGYRGGFAKPSGSGKRVIILHIGSEDGFLDSAMNCFIGDKNSSDYHDEMNARHYEEWFRKVLRLLPEKSVVVIDQAPYHTMIDPDYRNPNAQWTRSAIIEWLEKRQVPLPSDLSSFHDAKNKGRLLNLCQPYKYEKRYLLEKITQEERKGDVKLLWLPVAHCEFNPIELVWAYIKSIVAKDNKTFKVKDVHTLCIETMNNIPQDLWKNCVRHVIELEERYRGRESSLADRIEDIIINTNDDSDSCCSDSDGSDE